MLRSTCLAVLGHKTSPPTRAKKRNNVTPMIASGRWAMRASPRQKLRWTRTWPTTVFWSLNSYSAVGCGAVAENTELPDIFWFR